MSPNLQYILLVAGEICGILLVLRFMLPLFEVSYYNPFSQAVDFGTRWLCNLFRFIPSAMGGRLDMPAVTVVVLWYSGLAVLALWPLGLSIFWFQYLFYGLVGAALVFLSMVFAAIIISVILSWVSPFTRNPYAQVAMQINYLFCLPIRNILPSLGGLDFSPLFALLLIGIGRNLLLSMTAYDPLSWLMRML